MRREFNRPLVIWPSLATAVIIVLMWITAPGNPFTERVSMQTADVAAGVAASRWTPEGARDALRRLENSLHRSWDDESGVPWSDAGEEPWMSDMPLSDYAIEPLDRRERGSRSVAVPPRIAEAFGIDTSEDASVPAPVLDQQHELAGMVNPVVQKITTELTLPELDLIAQSATVNALSSDYWGTGATGNSSEGDDSPDFGNSSNVDAEIAMLFETTADGEVAESDAELGLAFPVATTQSENQPTSGVGPMASTEDIPSILELFEVAHDGLARSLEDVAANASDSKSLEPDSAIPESVRNLARPDNKTPDDTFIPENMLSDKLRGEPSTNDHESANDLNASSESNPTSEPVASKDLESANEIESMYIGDDVEHDGQDTGSQRDSYEYDSDKRFAVGKPGGWPVAAQLDQQLSSLSQLRLGKGQHSDKTQFVSDSSLFKGGSESIANIASWSERVALSLQDLRSLDRIGDTGAGAILTDLAQLAEQGRVGAEQVVDRELQVQWLRAAHGLNRRVQVWRPVWNIASGSTVEQTELGFPTSSDIQEAIAVLRSELSGTGDAAGWSRFLMLDEITAAASTADANERMIVAQRLLSRFHNPNLSDDQRRWMARESVARLSESVRPWASAAIDYSQLVSQIERQESNAIDLASIEIADAVQTLRFTASPEATRLADALNSYYRNANVRVAISSEMLQRFLPPIDPQIVPVRTHMLGSDVSGYSNIASGLDLQLVPAKNRWVIELRTRGNVNTQSVGRKSGVAVSTAGNSRFNAATPITITPNRVTINETTVDVQSNNRLRGVHSDYDSWPLVGALVRSVAVSQYEEMQGAARQLTNNQVRSQVAREIDQRVDEQLSASTTKFGQAVLGPLGQLKLAPMVVDMETTSDRLLARYRLAGDWQLAAFTPRPRAPGSSMVSVQMHQSAINNTLEQLVPRDQQQTVAQVIENGAKLFGFSLSDSTEELPNDVLIQFAQTRPITVEIEDGMVWITLRVMQLSRENSVDLRRFIVRAAYVPQIDGVNASLVRDGHLRISGPNLSMRERLPVRAIFNKVLSSNRSIPLVLPQLSEHPAANGLAVSQLELRDGWLALAISQADPSRVAVTTPRIAESATATRNE